MKRALDQLMILWLVSEDLENSIDTKTKAHVAVDKHQYLFAAHNHCKVPRRTSYSRINHFKSKVN